MSLVGWAVPGMGEERARKLRAVRERLLEARSVVLTTHVNPDGDGIGSMVALAHWLMRQGAEATIITPSRVPDSLHFLLGDVPALIGEDPAAADPLAGADTVAILDTAEIKRLGPVGEHALRIGGVLIDHHPPVGPPLLAPSIRDPAACATGELIFDFLSLEGEPPADAEPLTETVARGLYAAIATDTGSFGFSNTSARTHAIAAVLLGSGIDPGAMYRALYGTYSLARLALTRLGLERLEVDPRAPIAWIALDHKTLGRMGARNEDLEGLVEYPRRLEGVEVGLVFRGLGRQRTKVSFRSNSEVDVAHAARLLGGGGHPRAAGALIELPLEDTVRTVLDTLRPLTQALAADK